MPFYDKGDVRIHYEEVGAGFPLMIIPVIGLDHGVGHPSSRCRKSKHRTDFRSTF